MAAVRIDFDVSYEDKLHLKHVMDACEQHGSRILHYELEGPGGGNPRFVVEVPGGAAQARHLLSAVYGADPGDISHHIVQEA